MPKFTKAQLKELGFNPDDGEGVWSKGSVQADDPKPQAAKHKHNERKATLAEEEDKRSREGGFRYSLIIASYRTHKIDFSNFSVKQIEDMLSEPQGRKDYGIGVFPDDSIDYCDQPIHLQYIVKKGEERTEIRVLKYKI